MEHRPDLPRQIQRTQRADHALLPGKALRQRTAFLCRSRRIGCKAEGILNLPGQLLRAKGPLTVCVQI